LERNLPFLLECFLAFDPPALYQASHDSFPQHSPSSLLNDPPPLLQDPPRARPRLNLPNSSRELPRALLYADFNRPPCKSTQAPLFEQPHGNKTTPPSENQLSFPVPFSGIGKDPTFFGPIIQLRFSAVGDIFAGKRTRSGFFLVFYKCPGFSSPYFSNLAPASPYRFRRLSFLVDI